MLHRTPRRSTRFQSSSSSLGSLFPPRCSIRTVLISLLAVWILVVVSFVFQLSRSPPPHSPPSLFLNKPHPPLFSAKDNPLVRSNEPPQPMANLPDKEQLPLDPDALLLSQISAKLESQKHLPQEQRRIFSDIQLPPLPFSQPREIYDTVKEQFKNAKWKPESEKNITPKPTKKPTPSPVVAKPAKRSKYGCLYYCEMIRDRDCVLKHIQYWRKPHDKYDNDMDKIHKLFLPEPVLNKNYPMQSEGYVTFKSDCGGFNNLRQAYEYIIGVSWLTQRTLVFPVTEGWYLIDWGSIQVAAPQDTSGVSNYDMFYDMDHLSMVLPLMNLTDFLYKYQDDKALSLPQQYHMDRDHGKMTENWKWHTRQDFKKWQNDRSINESFAVPYGINHNVLLWPSYEDVEKSNTSKFSVNSKYYQKEVSLDRYIGHRKKREYFDKELGLHKKEYIHFPSCVDGEMVNYRYLGQVATAIAFADFELELKYKKLIRDHSHLVPRVFEIASFMISYLGLFEYTSAHIRRNDFQFKNSWVPPEKSFKNMVEHFEDDEVIYIASDAPKGFFGNVTKAHKQIKAIYRWADFVEKNGTLYEDFKAMYGDELDVSTIPRKLVHLVEMVIASGGKRFFGTTSSTYSAYINRLRGYIDAPDQGIYFHNKPGEYDFEARYRPTEYMIEFKDMWLDIKDYC
eukprot:169108_1